MKYRRLKQALTLIFAFITLAPLSASRPALDSKDIYGLVLARLNDPCSFFSFAQVSKTACRAVEDYIKRQSNTHGLPADVIVGLDKLFKDLNDGSRLYRISRMSVIQALNRDHNLGAFYLRMDARYLNGLRASMRDAEKVKMRLFMLLMMDTAYSLDTEDFQLRQQFSLSQIWIIMRMRTFEKSPYCWRNVANRIPDYQGITNQTLRAMIKYKSLFFANYSHHYPYRPLLLGTAQCVNSIDAEQIFKSVTTITKDFSGAQMIDIATALLHYMTKDQLSILSKYPSALKRPQKVMGVKHYTRLITGFAKLQPNCLEIAINHDAELIPVLTPSTTIDEICSIYDALKDLSADKLRTFITKAQDLHPKHRRRALKRYITFIQGLSAISENQLEEDLNNALIYRVIN